MIDGARNTVAEVGMPHTAGVGTPRVISSFLGYASGWGERKEGGRREGGVWFLPVCVVIALVSGETWVPVLG